MERDHPSDDDLRRSMFEYLNTSIEDGDVDFALNIAESQQLVAKLDLIEYLNIKRKREEDLCSKKTLDGSA